MDKDQPSKEDPIPPESPPAAEDPSQPRKELHVVSVPHDQDQFDQDMADLFEEDQVTHQHGSTEPEGD